MAETQSTAQELENEEWRPIPERTAYEVSNIGRVRSTARGKPRILRPWTRRGYKYVALRGVEHAIHRLVLLAFVGPCPPGMEACHRDGRENNNRPSNLRWDTHKANVDDQRRQGTLKLRRGNGGGLRTHSKLTPQQVLEIRAKHKPYFYSKPKLAKEYGVSVSAIQHILERKQWRSI